MISLHSTQVIRTELLKSCLVQQAYLEAPKSTYEFHRVVSIDLFCPLVVSTILSLIVESAKLSPQVKKKTFSVHSCISIQTCTHSCMHVQVQTAHASQSQFNVLLQLNNKFKIKIRKNVSLLYLSGHKKGANRTMKVKRRL